MAQRKGTALEGASKGLEGLMRGQKPSGVLDDGGTVQKIASVIFYQTSVLVEFVNSVPVQKAFRDKLFNQISFDLGEYMDMQARSKPKSLHHVYEWGSTGSKEARLFKIVKTKDEGFDFSFSYKFLNSKSKVPNNFGRQHIFKNKAIVMESGRGVIVSPKKATRLVFEIDGRVIFMKPGKSVKVRYPGGKMTNKSFASHYRKFTKGQLIKESIAKSGVPTMMKRIVFQSMNIPSYIRTKSYSYSASSIRGLAKGAVDRGAGMI